MSFKRRCARQIARSYKTYSRDFKRWYGRHSRWSEEGAEVLAWEAHVTAHPEDADQECVF